MSDFPINSEYFRFRPYRACKIALLMRHMLSLQEAIPSYEVWTTEQRQILHNLLKHGLISDESIFVDSFKDSLRIMGRVMEGFRVQLLGASILCPLFAFIVLLYSDSTCGISARLLKMLKSNETPSQILLREIMLKVKSFRDGLVLLQVDDPDVEGLLNILDDETTK